jgi:hypothetical protein
MMVKVFDSAFTEYVFQETVEILDSVNIDRNVSFYISNYDMRIEDFEHELLMYTCEFARESRLTPMWF